MADIYTAVITIPERRSYRERTVADLESHGFSPECGLLVARGRK